MALKCFKIQVQDHLDEDESPVTRTEYIACEHQSDLNNLELNIINSKQLIPFKVIE
jgi:hypothetical protein